jgi:hypothetical protein
MAGDESAVGGALVRLGEAGATDFLAIPFRVRGTRRLPDRTRPLLRRLVA